VIIIDIILIMLLLTVIIFLTYLLLLASRAMTLKYNTATSVEPYFVVLVPVHNESAVIHRLISSINLLDYPADKLDVLFVADHCDDDSAKIIRESGFEVMERNSGERGKPAALADGIKHILPRLSKDYDAVAIFDADNIIDKDFFQHVAYRLVSGSQIVQGNTVIENHTETPFLRVNHLNMVVTNRFKELARFQWGGCCRLRGHGMAFSKSILNTLDWQTNSLVEDQKMLLDLILANIRISWDHGARVSSVFPSTMEASAVQRMRWAGGKSILIKTAVKDLYCKFIKDKDFIAFDMMVDFIMPSYAVLVGMSFLGLAGSILINGLSLVSLGFLATTTIFLGYYFIGCYREGVPIKDFLWFFAAPFFVLWRVWIYLRSLRGPGAWH